jgi:hypothetical protein
MPALSLDDQEMDAVMQAAAPIDPARRGDVLEDLALELAKCPEVGPGSVYRIRASSNANISTRRSVPKSTTSLASASTPEPDISLTQQPRVWPARWPPLASS